MSDPLPHRSVRSDIKLNSRHLSFKTAEGFWKIERTPFTVNCVKLAYRLEGRRGSTSAADDIKVALDVIEDGDAGQMGPNLAKFPYLAQRRRLARCGPI